YGVSGVEHADGEFSLLEGDVKKSVVNGIPLIEFSKRIHQLLVNEMSISVVFKLLGINIGFVALQNKLYGIGRPSKPFQLMDIENGYFLAKFQMISYPNKVLTWVRFSGLPNYLYKKEVLWDIGGMMLVERRTKCTSRELNKLGKSGFEEKSSRS
ncbi:hypothetical protein Goari_006121, partial [Gossypium aridum]|nr:hypothetical protein [Gossypium aridum]